MALLAPEVGFKESVSGIRASALHIKRSALKQKLSKALLKVSTGSQKASITSLNSSAGLQKHSAASKNHSITSQKVSASSECLLGGLFRRPAFEALSEVSLLKSLAVESLSCGVLAWERPFDKLRMIGLGGGCVLLVGERPFDRLRVNGGLWVVEHWPSA